MATDVVTSLRIRTVGVTDRVTRLRVRNPTGGGGTDRITLLRIRNPNPASFTVNIAGPIDAMVPFQQIAFTSDTGSAMTADAFAWSIVSGGGSLIDANTDTAVFTAPAKPVSNSTIIRLTATWGTTITATDTITVTTASHSGLYRQNGSGAYLRRRPTTGSVALLPDSGVLTDSGRMLRI